MQSTMRAKKLVEEKQKSGYQQKIRADFTLPKVAALKLTNFMVR